MVATHVDVIPPRQAETEAALKAIADAGRKDAGNLRYDVFQQEGRLNHFNIVAVWQTRHAFDAHEATAHRLQFRDTVAPMLGALYDERLYTQAALSGRIKSDAAPLTASLSPGGGGLRKEVGEERRRALQAG